MLLREKRALITGSTSGIGLGIAQALAGQGAEVILNGFGDVAGAKAAVERAGEGHAGKVSHQPADLSRPAEIEAMMREVQETAGDLDILVNNAGIQFTAPLEDFPPERWDAILAINLSAPFHTIRCALPQMRRRGWGRIINIASAHGLVASVQKAAYVAAKHGLLGLTKVTALETARSAITCNAICPGWVQTPLVEAQVAARALREGVELEAARRSLLLEKQPSGEFVTPAQLGELVLFLCSDAASQVRGAAWAMDGGWTAQ